MNLCRSASQTWPEVIFLEAKFCQPLFDSQQLNSASPITLKSAFQQLQALIAFGSFHWFLSNWKQNLFLTGICYCTLLQFSVAPPLPCCAAKMRNFLLDTAMTATKRILLSQTALVLQQLHILSLLCQILHFFTLLLVVSTTWLFIVVFYALVVF